MSEQKLREALERAMSALCELQGIDTESECVTIDVIDEIELCREALAAPAGEQVGLTDEFNSLVAQGHLIDFAAFEFGWEACQNADRRSALTDDELQEAYWHGVREHSSNGDEVISGLRAAIAAHEAKK